MFEQVSAVQFIAKHKNHSPRSRRKSLPECFTKLVKKHDLKCKTRSDFSTSLNTTSEHANVLFAELNNPHFGARNSAKCKRREWKIAFVFNFLHNGANVAA